MVRILEHFRLLFSSIVSRPLATLGELGEILTEWDKQQQISLEKRSKEASAERLKKIRPRAVGSGSQ